MVSTLLEEKENTVDLAVSITFNFFFLVLWSYVINYILEYFSWMIQIDEFLSDCKNYKKFEA